MGVEYSLPLLRPRTCSRQLWEKPRPVPTRNPKTRLKIFSSGVGSRKTGRLEFMPPILLLPCVFHCRLRRLRKAQGRRIHAITQPRRLRAVIEYVPQVRIAFRARPRRPFHADAQVGNLLHVFFRDRLPEARPARSRVKLRRGTEQGVVAANAAEDTLPVLIQKLPSIGQFGVRVPRDLKHS